MSSREGASVASRAADTLAACQSLKAPALDAFFDLLIREFPSAAGSCRELFRRLDLARGGTAALVDMRRRLLNGIGEHPQWAIVETELVSVIKSRFDLASLSLRRIEQSTSPMVLEKLIQYEAVHQIGGSRDLRRRLEADRRCYAFFHPALTGEPVIFTEVALTLDLSATVQPLLDPLSHVLDPAACRCAIFYSISHCHEGLRGLSFGTPLIRQAMELLGAEFPRLRTFATLSPVPGFRSWLSQTTGACRDGVAKTNLDSALTELALSRGLKHEALLAALKRELVPLCAYYLLYARRGREPADPVARFHLGNGARLERLNWLGDVSAAGMRRSVGLMVNYLYRANEVERNQEAYRREGKVAASRQFEWLGQRGLAKIAARNRARIAAQPGD